MKRLFIVLALVLLVVGCDGTKERIIYVDVENDTPIPIVGYTIKIKMWWDITLIAWPTNDPVRLDVHTSNLNATYIYYGNSGTELMYEVNPCSRLFIGISKSPIDDNIFLEDLMLEYEVYINNELVVPDIDVIDPDACNAL